MLSSPVQHPPTAESNFPPLHHSVKGSLYSTATSSQTADSQTKLSSSSSTYQSLAKTVEMEKPLTNVQICKLIADRLAELRSALSSRASLYSSDGDCQLEADRNTSAHLHSTSSRDAQSLLHPAAREPPEDQGDPHLAEHSDTWKQRGLPVFAPSELETSDGSPHALSDVAPRECGEAKRKAPHVTGSERKGSSDERRRHNPERKSLKPVLMPFTCTARTGVTISAVTSQTGPAGSETYEMVHQVTGSGALCYHHAGGVLSVSVRDPQYDDVSDEDLPKMTMIKADKVLGSEDVAMETTSPPPEVPEACVNWCGQEQVQAEVRSASEEQTSEGKRCQDSCSASPCITLEDDHDSDSQPDDDGWEVIPVSIANLQYKPAEASDPQGGCRAVVQKPVPASAFSQLEVFDTPVEQKEAVKFGQLSFVVPSSCSSHTQSHSSQKRKETCSEDSYETEDSCDYSPDPERNFLTVPSQLLKKPPASALPATSDSSDRSENETKDGEGRNFPKGQSSRRQKDDIIILDSGDESDDDANKRRRKRRRAPTARRSQEDGSNLAPEAPRQIQVDDSDIITILSDSDD